MKAPRLWTGLLLTLGYACSTGVPVEPSERFATGDSCYLASDCEEPLVCAFGRCHIECQTTRDCKGEQLCVNEVEASRVCRLEDESACAADFDCPDGLVCGVDGTCRNGCDSGESCVDGQLCVSGVCAEAEELDESGNLEVVLASPGCRLNSDCDLGERCALGSCVRECLEDVDCPSGRACEGGACLYPSSGACDTEDDCESGQACFGGACLCACRENVDCPSGVCDGCGCSPPSTPECATDAECAAPEICASGRCGCACLGDRDCGAGSECDGCACVPSSGPSTIDSAIVRSGLDIERLRGVTKIRGELWFVGNKLASCDGLEELAEIGSLNVNGSGLEGLACLSGLTKVDGPLIIMNNEKLASLGLPPGLEVTGDATVAYNGLGSCAVEDFHESLVDAGFTGSFSGFGAPCSGSCSGPVCTP